MILFSFSKTPFLALSFSKNQTSLSLGNQSTHELGGHYSSSSIDGYFHTIDLLVDILHELDDKVDELVFDHPLQMHMSDQKRHIVPNQSKPSFYHHTKLSITHPSEAFLLIIINCSALCIRNRVNL